MTHSEIIDLLMVLDAKLSREDSKLLTGKVNKAVRYLRSEQNAREAELVRLIEYEQSCDSVDLWSMK